MKRMDDGREGEPWAVVDDTAPDGEMTRYYWVRLPDGTNERWTASEVESI